MSLVELSEDGFQGRMRTDVIEKVHYDGPISIANLFSDSNVKYTLNHIFASFIDRVNEARRASLDCEEPVVFSQKHNAFLVEYTFITDCLAELVDDKIALMRDFAINYDDTRNAEFLVVSLLENMLGLVKMNSPIVVFNGRKEINYKPSFMKPVVFQYESFNDDDPRFIQMSAVIFRTSALINMLNSDIYDSIFLVCKRSSYVQVPGAFGRKACSDFWVKAKKEGVFFNRVN